MPLKTINYQTETDVIQVVAQDKHAWVTVSDITMILNITQQTVSHHISALESQSQFKEGKHVITFPITQVEGTREVTRQIKHYSELVVIRIGFRSNSPEALAFQEWAAETLLTLKRDGVVFDTSERAAGTEHLTDYEKWDYYATHELLDALNIPPMESLTGRIGLLMTHKKPLSVEEGEIYTRNTYKHVNAATIEAMQEERVINAIKKRRQKFLRQDKDQWPTEREIAQNISTAISRAQIREHINNLIMLGIVESFQRTNRRQEYILTEETEATEA